MVNVSASQLTELRGNVKDFLESVATSNDDGTFQIGDVKVDGKLKILNAPKTSAEEETVSEEEAVDEEKCPESCEPSSDSSDEEEVESRPSLPAAGI